MLPRLCEESRTTVAVGDETKVPEKNPYSAAKTIKLATLFMGIKQKHRMAEIKAQGVMTFIGPTMYY